MVLETATAPHFLWISHSQIRQVIRFLHCQCLLRKLWKNSRHIRKHTMHSTVHAIQQVTQPVWYPMRCRPSTHSSCRSQSPAPRPRVGQTEAVAGQSPWPSRTDEWSSAQRTRWIHCSLWENAEHMHAPFRHPVDHGVLMQFSDYSQNYHF